MPEPVEYATAGRRGDEAVRSLARAWGISETRAAECLGDPAAYRAEMRAHMTPQQARRELERRYAVPLS